MKVLIPSVLALVGGGLAGALFQWWVNLPATTILAYNLNTSVIGIERESKNPELRIEARGVEVSALYVHAFDFTVPQGGYIERAEIAIVYPTVLRAPTRSMNITTSPASPLHELSCQRIETGARCILGPLSPTHSARFHVTIATDDSTPPTPMTVAKSVEILPIARFLAETRRWARPEYLLAGIAILAAIAAAVSWWRYVARMRARTDPASARESGR